MAVRKTLEQRIVEKEQELRRLKAQARAADRKARTHRLITSAAKIEADAGIELDALWASEIARAISSGVIADPHGRDGAQGPARGEGAAGAAPAWTPEGAR